MRRGRSPPAVRLKLRSTIGCALPPVPSRNASSSRVERRRELRCRVPVEPRRPEAGHQHLRLVAGHDDVRLEGAEAALDDLAAERGDVVVGVELRRPGHLPGPRPRRAAMRPVERDVSRVGPPKSSYDGDAERLRPSGRAARSRSRRSPSARSTRALPRRAVEIPVDRLDRARIAADDERREIGDDAREARGEPCESVISDQPTSPSSVVALRKSHGPPAGVAGQRLEGGELQARQDTVARRRPGARPTASSSRRARSKSSSSSMLRPS